MKKLSFLALLAAGMLLGACTSDKDAAEDVTPVIDTQGESYVGISIQLPNATTPTRNNDEYDDGDATEFAVNSGKIFLFKGTSEATATFLQASDIINPGEGWNTDGSTYVTSTKVAVAKIDKLTLTTAENLYAYVALNYVGTALATNPDVGTSFSTWSQTRLAAAKTGGTLNGAIGTNGLLMTNAPIADKQGGSKDPSLTTAAKVTTAVRLDKDQVKATKELAEASPSGCVFVERAAAKVTFTVTETDTSIDMGGTALAMSLDDIVMQIINTEPEFYNARQANVSAWLPYYNADFTNANSKWRFVSNNLFSPQLPTTTNHQDGYRTYFAQDPQYSTNATLDKPQANDAKDAPGSEDDFWVSKYVSEVKMQRAYVPENTFTTAMQMRRNTTCATFRVKFNGGADFYTISNDAKYYTATNAQNQLATLLMADYNVDAKLQAACTDIAANKNGNNEVNATLTVELTTTAAGNVTYTATPSFTGTGGTWSINDITNATVKSNLTSAISTAMQNDYKVTLYKGGLAYYNVRIKHFGDVETPWSAAGAYVTKPGSTTEQIYGSTDADKNFLGRYGIVRDNWYQLTIKDIKKLGSATPPSVSGDNTPDDEIEDEYYISAHVHIVPWVLRKQNVDLQ